MKRKKIIKIIEVILIAVLVIAIFNIGKIGYDYIKSDNTYNGIQNEYVASNEIPPSSATTSKNEDKETVLPEPPITVNFDSLLKRNQDIIGWIYSSGTVINYPIVQGENNDQYLKNDLDGKYLFSGTLFVDFRNGALGEDGNYIIYGHNMKNGTMFGSLIKYKQQSYYDQHPVMYFLTPNGNYRLELFAGLVVKHDDKIYGPNQSKEEFFGYINEYRAKSTFKSNVELQENDIVLTLSTCSYEFSNARYIVIGKLILI